MINKSIRVFGKVQGVSYRYSTRLKANELGINGTVQNQVDGTVLIHASGTQDSIDSLIDWCHQGPEYAKVSRVIVEEIEALEMNTFMIIRH